MADPFVAEIRIVGCNFAPTGWAFCDGQLMPLSQNTALFSLLGTTYGGDGRTTFALPDLQGRAPMHPGQGPGLSLRNLGESAGSPTVTLVTSEIPTHTHALRAVNAPGNRRSPIGNIPARTLGAAPYLAPANAVSFSSQALPPVGGGLPHNNMMPYLALTFVIALQGVFPPRS